MGGGWMGEWVVGGWVVGGWVDGWMGGWVGGLTGAILSKNSSKLSKVSSRGKPFYYTYIVRSHDSHMFYGRQINATYHINCSLFLFHQFNVCLP